jgi:hypothetical protein
MRSKKLRKEDIEAGIVLLERQIEGARHLLKQRPLNNKTHAAWSEETRSCLIKIYGLGSPNVRSLESTVGATPVWMGMPPEVAETYQSSRLERTVSMLKSCIVALKRRAGNSGRKRTVPLR